MSRLSGLRTETTYSDPWLPAGCPPWAMNHSPLLGLETHPEMRGKPADGRIRAL